MVRKALFLILPILLLLHAAVGGLFALQPSRSPQECPMEKPAAPTGCCGNTAPVHQDRTDDRCFLRCCCLPDGAAAEETSLTPSSPRLEILALTAVPPGRETAPDTGPAFSPGHSPPPSSGPLYLLTLTLLI